MSQQHLFEGRLAWTGGASTTADGKLKLDRAFRLDFDGKAAVEGSSPSVFSGDDGKHNPETLMVASLMSCHHLTYVALAERAGIGIATYHDHAAGTLAIKDGKMRMVQVLLRPQVTITDAAQLDRATALHAKAHENCFMSNSVNFEVVVQPDVKLAAQ
jgi:organic hydroperoxide reductase OsmC/OhrA